MKEEEDDDEDVEAKDGVKETKQALDLWEALVNRCDLKDGSSA